jgi:hypothetical protein
MVTLKPGAIPGKVSLGWDSFISVLPYVPGGKSVCAHPKKKGKEAGFPQEAIDLVVGSKTGHGSRYGRIAPDYRAEHKRTCWIQDGEFHVTGSEGWSDQKWFEGYNPQSHFSKPRHCLTCNTAYGGAFAARVGYDVLEFEPSGLRDIIGRDRLTGAVLAEDGDQEVMMLQFVFIVVQDDVEGSEDLACFRLNAGFLTQFPDRRIHDRFARFDLATGITPEAHVRLVASAHQQQPGISNDDGECRRDRSVGHAM